MKIANSKKFYLAYSIACPISKQAIKVSKKKNISLTYLVVYTDKIYYKISKGRKVYLIYLVFFIAHN